MASCPFLVAAILPLALPLALAGCGRQHHADGANARPTRGPVAGPTGSFDAPPTSEAPAVTPTPATPLAAGLVRKQWHDATNWQDCAPITFTSDGGDPGKAHPVKSAGGWAVAFDRPAMPNAYGIAGPALAKADRDDAETQVNRLMNQWPYFLDLPNLPDSAFAGYGLAGGATYPAANPDGKGLRSVAMVRIGGQECTYRVWSLLGRKHLEALLRSLRML